MDEFPRLTNREDQVLRLVLQGKSNKQIAWELGIADRTVEFHLKNIYFKFAVSSRIELILKLGKLTGGLDAEKLGISTVAHRVKIAENRTKLNQPFGWAKSVFGKEIEMKALISKHVLVGMATAVFTGLAWVFALIYSQKLFMDEVRPWNAFFIAVWAVGGLTLGLVGKCYKNTLKRVFFATFLGVGLSPLTIIPLMLSVVLPIGRIAERFGVINASTMPGTVATKLTIITMITIWLFASLVIGVLSLFLNLKKPENSILPTQAGQTL